MKEIISKIRKNRLKGNISLLVILILLASSVIAILSINQIQRLLTYGNMTFNYFRAFYLAKAGTELGLTEVYNRGNGFEHSIDSGNVIVTQNLIGIYSGFNPYFTMEIKSNFKRITNDVRDSSCSGDNMITLGTGDGIVLSLFKDNTDTKKFKNILGAGMKIYRINDEDIKQIRIEKLDSKGGVELTFGLFSYDDDGNMNNIVVKKGKNKNDLKNFLDGNIASIKGNNRYLTIKNSGTGDAVAKFCIYMDGKPIPYSDYLVTVRGHYGDMEVGLQSIVKKGVPAWTLNVIGEPNP